MSLIRHVSLCFGGLGLICGVGCGAGGSNSTGQPGTPQTNVGQPAQQVPTATNPATTNPTTAPTNTGPTGVGGGAAQQPTPTMGAAGNAAIPPAGSGGAPATGIAGTTGLPDPNKMAMDECGLHTAYAGDEYCILPPPKDKGFQLHIGPTNYDNPEAQYLLAAGQEITTDFPTVSSNDQKIYFYYRQFRMRNGAHHNIITSGSGGDNGLGQRIGTANNLAEDDPKGGMIAPENQDVGIALGAKSSINVSLHSINISQKTELREIWVNFWYRDASVVKEPVNEVFLTGDPTLGGGVPPGADVVLGPYNCTVSGMGRVLWMYGHRHANNTRFSIWRIRGGMRDLVYQGYNWEEPMVLDYASNVTNAKPDTAPNVEGGWSGILDVQSGDQLSWECHVVNKTMGTLLFTNNTYTGEMCILDGEMVGANCSGF